MFRQSQYISYWWANKTKKDRKFVVVFFFSLLCFLCIFYNHSPFNVFCHLNFAWSLIIESGHFNIEVYGKFHEFDRLMHIFRCDFCIIESYINIMFSFFRCCAGMYWCCFGLCFFFKKSRFTLISFEPCVNMLKSAQFNLYFIISFHSIHVSLHFN